MVAALIADGNCAAHASLYGALVAVAIDQEAERRAVLPGSVHLRYVEISDEPYETISPGDAMRMGRVVVTRAAGFVARSGLSAIVEVDCRALRARVTLQLADLEPPATTVLDSRRLVHTSAQEISDALRMRRVVG